MGRSYSVIKIIEDSNENIVEHCDYIIISTKYLQFLIEFTRNSLHFRNNRRRKFTSGIKQNSTSYESAVELIWLLHVTAHLNI